MLWERTVMGISVHTAETEMAKTPYYYHSIAFGLAATIIYTDHSSLNHSTIYSGERARSH